MDRYEGRAKLFNDVVAVDYDMDLNKVNLCEGITVITRSGGNAQARILVNFAVVVTEPSNCDDGISLGMSLVVCENPTTGISENKEWLPV